MNISIDEIILRLNQSEEYRSYFKMAFKGTNDTTINYYGILKAIEEFEKHSYQIIADLINTLKAIVSN